MIKVKWVDGKDTTFHYAVKAEPISPELMVLKDINDKICYYISVKEMRYVTND